MFIEVDFEMINDYVLHTAFAVFPLNVFKMATSRDTHRKTE